jgi:hypothetical protein
MCGSAVITRLALGTLTAQRSQARPAAQPWRPWARPWAATESQCCKAQLNQDSSSATMAARLQGSHERALHDGLVFLCLIWPWVSTRHGYSLCSRSAHPTPPHPCILWACCCAPLQWSSQCHCSRLSLPPPHRRRCCAPRVHHVAAAATTSPCRTVLARAGETRGPVVVAHGLGWPWPGARGMVSLVPW